VKVSLDFRPGLLVLLLFVLTPTLASYARDRATPALDPGYAAALAAADHFLQAWQSGDAESGAALLTSHAKDESTSAALDKFFESADPVSGNRAYEIGRGKMLKRGRYEFPVVMIGDAATNRHSRRSSSRIIVVNTGHSDWAIDRLP